jgi:hypothetical protein
MSALGWLASSGDWDRARFCCNSAAAQPQGGSEPRDTDAALYIDGRVITESRAICRYLDVAFPNSPLTEVTAFDQGNIAM